MATNASTDRNLLKNKLTEHEVTTARVPSLIIPNEDTLPAGPDSP